MKKRIIISLALSVVLLLSTVSAAFADESTIQQNINSSQYDVETVSYFPNETVIYFDSDHMIDKELSNDIKTGIDNGTNSILYSSHGGSQWKTVYGTTVNKIISGYAGNQLPGGYKSPKGSQIYYSTQGGPIESLGVSFGSPFGSFTITGNTGVKAGSVTDLSVIVPSGSYYYKIWADKTYRVTPFVTYNMKNGEWVVYSRGCGTEYYRVSLTPKKVG